MSLKEGRVGKQEGVCILCIVLVIINVFALNSSSAYSVGNTSYIWLPCAVLLAVLAAVLLLFALEYSGEAELCSLYIYGLGALFGRVALLALSLMLIWQSLLLQASFANALQLYVFQKSQYAAILFWITAGGAYIAWGGLERLTRSAKCVGVLLGVVLLSAVLMPSKAYSSFRLFPFPGETVSALALKGVCASVNALPAMLCLLGFCRGFQGVKNTRRICVIGCAISAVLLFIVQLALALTYVSEELRQMLMPMFRIDMTLLIGNYQFRQDKVTLFIWLMGAIPAAAFLEYGAAFIFCKLTGIRNIRIPLLGVFLLVFIALLLSAYQYPTFAALRSWLDVYGVCFVWPAALLCAISTFLRVKKKVSV